MTIKGKVHCFFEQSGTFKREFIKLGIPAEDYDIQNNFNETDHVADLFGQIEAAYEGGVSVFDTITKDDLIMAFFPCIYFCGIAQINITLANYEYKFKTLEGCDKYIFDRIAKRDLFYSLLLKLCFVCLKRGIRLVIENPYTTNTYLKGNFIKPPSIVDTDRTRRGDAFTKATAYWFFNAEPTHCQTFQQTKEDDKRFIDIHSNKNHKGRNVKGSQQAGICSEERSMITHDYARNFICDFILGKPSSVAAQQGDLFG